MISLRICNRIGQPAGISVTLFYENTGSASDQAVARSSVSVLYKLYVDGDDGGRRKP